jgi:hypothetical protein
MVPILVSVIFLLALGFVALGLRSREACHPETVPAGGGGPPPGRSGGGFLIAGGVATILTTATGLAFSDGETASLWACFAGAAILLVYLGIAAFREENA